MVSKGCVMESMVGQKINLLTDLGQIVLNKLENLAVFIFLSI